MEPARELAFSSLVDLATKTKSFGKPAFRLVCYLCFTVLMLVARGLSSEGAAVVADQPPPNLVYVELWVNNKKLNGVWTVGVSHEQLWLPSSRWQETGIDLKGTLGTLEIESEVYYAIAPTITYQLDLNALTLRLEVPVTQLNLNIIDEREGADQRNFFSWAWYWNHHSFFNHDPKQRQLSLVSHHSGNILFPRGIINNTLIASFFDRGYRAARLDTSLTIDLAKNNLRLIAGDSSSDGPAWSTTRSLAGIKVQKGYFITRGAPTYPTINLFGALAHDGQIEIMIDEHTRLKKDLAMGNFIIDTPDLPLGAQKGSLIIKDSGGVITTIPFSYYADSEFLRPSFNTFSYSAGWLRQNYGRSSFDYEGLALFLNHKIGVTNFWTTSLHGQLAHRHAVAGAEQRLRLFNVGPLAVACGASVKDERYGYTIATELGLNLALLNINNRATYASPFFQPVGILDNQTGFHNFAAFSTLRINTELLRKTSLTHMLLLKSGFVKQSLGLNQSIAIGNYVSLGLSASYDISQDNAMFMALLSTTFEPRQFASIGSEYSHRQLSSYANYQIKSDPQKPHSTSLGVLANYDYRMLVRAFASYDNPFVQSRLTTNISSNTMSYGLDFANAFGMIGPKFFLGHPVQSGLALINIPGVQNVRVLRERTVPVGVTDQDGLLVIKNLGSYRDTTLSFDTKTINPNIRSTELEKDIRFYTALNSAHRFDLTAPRILRLSFNLAPQGQQLKTGTRIIFDGDTYESFIDHNGNIYLETTSVDGHISGHDEDNICHFHIDVTIREEDIVQNLGTVNCD